MSVREQRCACGQALTSICYQQREFWGLNADDLVTFWNSGAIPQHDIFAATGRRIIEGRCHLIAPGPPRRGPQLDRQDEAARQQKILRARQAAAQQSVEARIARYGSAAPVGGAKGRTTQQTAAQTLIRQFTPATDPLDVARRATALWSAWMRARRHGWTKLSLKEWAPEFLQKGSA